MITALVMIDRLLRCGVCAQVDVSGKALTFESCAAILVTTVSVCVNKKGNTPAARNCVDGKDRGNHLHLQFSKMWFYFVGVDGDSALAKICLSPGSAVRSREGPIK